jgi:hypothetical protein
MSGKAIDKWIFFYKADQFLYVKFILLISLKIIIFDFYYLFYQFMGKNYRNCNLSSYRRF